MRQCPTLEGDARSLIMHRIGVELCMSRQRGFYHKCHRCAFRGKPASYTPDAPQFETEAGVAGMAVNGSTAKAAAAAPAGVS